MYAYEVKTEGCYSQKHLVIAENFAQAETYFERDYPTSRIREITLDAVYVVLPKEKE